MFHWIEPQICRDDVNGATSLPVSGHVEDCPPCNPGMFMNGTTCVFCPPMTYNNGKNKGETIYTHKNLTSCLNTGLLAQQLKCI